MGLPSSLFQGNIFLRQIFIKCLIFLFHLSFFVDSVAWNDSIDILFVFNEFKFTNSNKMHIVRESLIEMHLFQMSYLFLTFWYWFLKWLKFKNLEFKWNLYYFFSVLKVEIEFSKGHNSANPQNKRTNVHIVQGAPRKSEHFLKKDIGKFEVKIQYLK